ncbi:MAG TPA: hypothetical protein VKK79_19330 [Candidatus Lokiarchaeia archaeon]|nr:hypothetical protein [Candidatus Lokiarchaeia archaeon]
MKIHYYLDSRAFNFSQLRAPVQFFATVVTLWAIGMNEDGSIEIYLNVE